MAVSSGSRIPPALQAVFLASNQGQEVHEPPKDGSAYRVFRRNGQRKFRSGSLMRHPFFEGLRSMFGKTSPQALFHRKLKERGYRPKHFECKNSGYYNQPTKHQLASFGVKVLNVLKRDETIEFRGMLEAGLSPNACNSHGESLLHMVCRQSQVRMFRILVEFFVDPRQADDCGRTPLHEACLSSTPSFEIIRWLIRSDPGFLFLLDDRGSLPLDLVNKALWPQFHKFILEAMDEFFPMRGLMDITPGLWGMPPNSRPVPNDWNALPPLLASKVASGELAPHEVQMMLTGSATSDDTFFFGDGISSSDDDDSSYSSSESGFSGKSDDDEEDEGESTCLPSLHDDQRQCTVPPSFLTFENGTLVKLRQ